MTSNTSDPKKASTLAASNDEKRPNEVVKPHSKRRFSIFESMGPDIVELYIGPEQKLMRVHKDILCEKVPYFEKAFEGGLGEAWKSKATFPEDDVSAFECLLHWVYTNRIVKQNTKPDYHRSSIMYRTYVLADRFWIPALMDKMIPLIQEYDKQHKLIPGIEQVRIAYLGTSIGSPLRRYCARSWYYSISTFGLKSAGMAVEFPKVLLLEQFALDFAIEASCTSGIKDIRSERGIKL
ncbi:hypothetical protein PVAG01_09515 [Phlyctema vagabunda]|uniref:BTB domain-containing protein n=1 Tax=Phlyctema vagabunda TaxID=108571 RepID=A0ABR4P7K8_9HELO